MSPFTIEFMEIFSKRGVIEILIALVENDETKELPLATSKLNELVGLSPRTYYAAIKVMDSGGLIEQVPKDKPVKHVQINLTEIGRKIGYNFKSAKDEWVNHNTER